jgi:hypothetical protein
MHSIGQTTHWNRTPPTSFLMEVPSTEEVGVVNLDELRSAIDMVERGKVLVARQRSRLAALGSTDDTHEMSNRVLLTLEEALRLMIVHRSMVARELKRNGQLTGNDTAYLGEIPEG